MKNIIFFLQGGIGKHIAATAVAEAITKQYPDRRLIVVCPYPEIFLNNPFIYRVYKSTATQYFYADFIKDKDVIFLGNEVYQSNEYVAQNKHLILSWCEMLGVKYNGENPRLFLNQSEIFNALKKFNRENRPLLVMQTNGGGIGDGGPIYSWARDIYPFFAQDLINSLKDKYHIMHVAREDQQTFQNAEKVSGSIRELFALLTISTRRLLIDSFLQHASAALGLPSVVLWIGTDPNKLGYNLHKNILAKESAKIFSHDIDGIILEKEFIGLPYQCNFDLSKSFDLDDIKSFLV